MFEKMRARILKKKRKKNADRLDVLGIKFIKTRLGEAVFVPFSATDASKAVRPGNWSVSQLRAMANYMELNPNCTIFSDGSGKPVKL